MKYFLLIVVVFAVASLTTGFQSMRTSRIVQPARLQMASYKVHIIDKKNGVDANLEIDENEFILDGAERQVLVPSVP
jgi:hypothetical protein